MKTYTLEQVLSKLIKRKYIENQTPIKVYISGDTIRTTKASLCRDESTLLLAPVTTVYISFGGLVDNKRLITISDSGIDYDITTASIKRDIRKRLGSEPDDIYSCYILTFVCQKLPDVFLNSFLYQEGFMSPDIYRTLTRHKNTIMNTATYSQCVYWINKHKNYVIKQYGFKEERLNDEPSNGGKLLADVLSIVTGFKVKIRLGSEGTVGGYYVIEAVE